MFPRKPSSRNWAWLGLLIVILIAVGQTSIGQRINLGMSPLLSALKAPGEWWQETGLWFEERSSLQSQLLETSEQLAKQVALQQELVSLREENAMLRQLLDIKQLKGYHWHAAKVQGRSPDKMSQRLILLVDNARPDDVIASREGLVGLVDQAMTDRAVVRTILDASLAVPVTTRDRPLAALVRGQGDSLEVDFVLSREAPAEGSILYTSGAGGLFPPGIPVARITRVEPIEGEVFARIEAVPVAHWQRESWLAMASRDGAAGK